ncbi:portal protein [Edwardsiella piscicida]|uniref:portal protein n=1 Tax=Edwardsiella piscicida TaxID=1263550 RepID=UPI001CECBF4A|nr:portal protein [Edwardsiella piscicida]AOP42933.2 portal protein [Edwardsiella piscicida]
MTDPFSSPDISTAPDRQGQFTLAQLLSITADIHHQPDWRSAANKACAYYDGEQLPPELIASLLERSQPLTMHNLIAPTVDGVLGMEAKTRTELMVVADDPRPEFEALAEAVNAEFADACRLANLGKARSDAYAGMLKAGLEWVEVRRSDNIFGPRYRAGTVHRNEVYWDWHSREPDLSDCRWLLRRRWMDLDEALATFPAKAAILQNARMDWRGFIDTELAEGLDADLVAAYEEYQQYSRRELEWLSSDRRVLLQVVYYRSWVALPVMTLANGRALEYQAENPLHAAALAMGRVQVQMARSSRIREAWFAGPHQLVDRPCTAPQGMFPLIPFWGYRKDRNGAPYGLVSRAIPAQDEVNFRRIKLTFLLTAKRVIMDDDAVNMSRKQVQEEVERPDGLIILNPDRRNKTTIAQSLEVQQDFQVAQQQFQVMQDSMKLIQDGMGVYSAFLGQNSNATSGVAISNLVEQGATTLAELNDNYQFACQQVGQLLLGYLLEDLARVRNHTIVVNRDDARRRKNVAINVEGNDGMSNDITRLRAHIALAPIQQTPAYRSQLADRLGQVVAGLPPQVQAAVLDLWISLLDIPNKTEFVERIRQAVGMAKSADEMTPEEQEAAAQQQQVEQQQLALAMRELEAKVGKLEAEAQRAAASAQREQAQAEGQRFHDMKTQAETGQILQGMQQDAQAARQQLLTLIEQQIAAMPLH